MKILLCIRQDYYRNFAGDSMQVLKTAECLRKLGAEVDINNGAISDYSSYDIIHLFNIIRIGETYKYYKLANYYKKPIVVSPVYWNLNEYYKYKNNIEAVKLWEKSNVYRRKILKGCKMIIANSELERNALKNDFKLNLPSTVIYSGVEVEDEEIPLYNFKERHNLNSYVLCVGRICPSKNQLTLAKVCNKLGVQLLLIGNVKDENYFKECIKFNNVLYLGFMDSYNIYNAYRFAKLHVLASYMETPGLSSLEAAASGCNIVSTIEGTAKEYFKDMAIYCDPYDENSIFEAVQKGMKKRKINKLKDFVLENYSWEKHCKKLYEVYEVLKVKNTGKALNFLN
ncbi:glycosyltransferase family 4 protein [Clostridium ganghwense]|uniref:Glycosyltransferase family 4 protein n=1 Tax=Clostridium ganghwense TaxID=312089 RepID=A0ABT4CNC0_9CLOT|nr:glycosyltransferase family 4 protein [Clostridium ganghwense]MCY6370545.1 glycosyltransferase family 4 protein [Clostridium ganghwense]